MRTRNTYAAMAAAGATLALTLSACGGGGGSPDQSGEAAAGDIVTGKDCKADSLTIWDYENDSSAMGQAWAKAVEIFQQEYPDTEVILEEQTFEQLQKNAKIALTGDDVPDLMEYNKGNATAGQLASQGLITPLDDYAAAFGWDELLSGSIATTGKYDEQGLMGSGSWYGIPNYGEYVGLYYNQTMFDELGLSAPTSMADLEAAMDKFKAEGVTPLATAGAEYPFGQLWYELVLTNSDRSFVDAYQLFTEDVDFHGDNVMKGTEKAKDWLDKGYIASDSAGLVAEDMGVSFISGKYPMMYSGSWWFGRLAEEMSDDWGIVPFPESDLHPGSSGNLWVIPTNAKNPCAAANFIDITLRPEVQQVFAETGGLPVTADEFQIDDPKVEELTKNFQEMVANDGLAFYPDWPVPGFYDVLVAQGQSLINGSQDPQTMLQGLSDAYFEGREDLLNG